MQLLILACILLVLIILIAWVKVHPFLAFLIVSVAGGLLLGIPLEKITGSIKSGFGSMLGELAVVITLGAMLGKLVAASGAAQSISNALIQLFGEKYLQWGMLVTGFVVGIPLFYNVGFVLLVPLAFTIIYRTGTHALVIGIPMLAALSVTHGFLPPHPSPVALCAQLNASPGKVLFYGLLIAIPAVIVAGPLFASTLKRISVPQPQLFRQQEAITDLPGGAVSFISALLPACLLLLLSAFSFLPNQTSVGKSIVTFAGDPIIILIVSLFFATYSLGLRRKKKLTDLMTMYGEAVKDVSVILLIIAGAGAFKQVLTDSGLNQVLGQSFSSVSLNPLMLGWFIAAIIRVCLGSATVAGITAAGIVVPLTVQYGVSPELMVLSVGTGSLMFSHVNDSGFWMFKEYFNLSVRDTIRSWSVMESIVSIMGLAGVLFIDWLI